MLLTTDLCHAALILKVRCKPLACFVHLLLSRSAEAKSHHSFYAIEPHAARHTAKCMHFKYDRNFPPGEAKGKAKSVVVDTTTEFNKRNSALHHDCTQWRRIIWPWGHSVAQNLARWAIGISICRSSRSLQNAGPRELVTCSWPVPLKHALEEKQEQFARLNGTA